MKVGGWLHSEKKEISFNYCQFFYDLLLSYKRNVTNSAVDHTDWSRPYFLFLSCSQLQITHYFIRSFQTGASPIKECSEQHSKHSLNAATSLRFFSNFKLKILMDTICTSQYISRVEKRVVHEQFHWCPGSLCQEPHLMCFLVTDYVSFFPIFPFNTFSWSLSKCK